VTWFNCPESIYGIHDAYDVQGKCCLCRRKIASKASMPRLNSDMKSNLELAYAYHFDPNYGDDVYDTY